jgi:hypothetical protein
VLRALIVNDGSDDETPAKSCSSSSCSSSTCSSSACRLPSPQTDPRPPPRRAEGGLEFAAASAACLAGDVDIFRQLGEGLIHLAFGAAGAGAGATGVGAGLTAGTAATTGADFGAAIAGAGVGATGAGMAIGLTATFTAALGAPGAANALVIMPGTASPNVAMTTSLLAQ